VTDIDINICVFVSVSVCVLVSVSVCVSVCVFVCLCVAVGAAFIRSPVVAATLHSSNCH